MATDWNTGLNKLFKQSGKDECDVDMQDVFDFSQNSVSYDISRDATGKLTSTDKSGKINPLSMPLNDGIVKPLISDALYGPDGKKCVDVDSCKNIINALLENDHTNIMRHFGGTGGLTNVEAYRKNIADYLTRINPLIVLDRLGKWGFTKVVDNDEQGQYHRLQTLNEWLNKLPSADATTLRGNQQLCLVMNMLIGFINNNKSILNKGRSDAGVCDPSDEINTILKIQNRKRFNGSSGDADYAEIAKYKNLLRMNRGRGFVNFAPAGPLGFSAFGMMGGSAGPTQMGGYVPEGVSNVQQGGMFGVNRQLRSGVALIEDVFKTLISTLKRHNKQLNPSDEQKIKDMIQNAKDLEKRVYKLAVAVQLYSNEMVASGDNLPKQVNEGEILKKLTNKSLLYGNKFVSVEEKLNRILSQLAAALSS
jgi:hypothetical protein